MGRKNTKVAIVGTGLVGSSTAFSLVTQGVCDEILMIDINKERVSELVNNLRNINVLVLRKSSETLDFIPLSSIDMVCILLPLSIGCLRCIVLVFPLQFIWI